MQFMSHLINNVFPIVKDAKWRYDIMMKSSTGEPHEIGQTILATGGNIETKLNDFLSALSNRFGSVDKIVTESIREVRRHQIEVHNFESHIKFYTKLKNVYEMSTSFGYSYEFDNVKGISIFLRKIPEPWKQKFIEKMTKKGISNRAMFTLDTISGEVSLNETLQTPHNISFEDFLKFYKNQIDLMQNVFEFYRGHKSHSDRGRESRSRSNFHNEKKEVFTSQQHHEFSGSESDLSDFYESDPPPPSQVTALDQQKLAGKVKPESRNKIKSQ